MAEPLVGEKGDGNRMRAILVLTTTVGFISAPVWSAGFGGFDPDAFPVPLDDPPTQPAVYVFGIWGMIYLWLLASALFGLLVRSEDASWDAGRWWLIASLVLGAPWISVAKSSPVLATLLILGMFATALRAVWLSPQKDRWALRLPLALYAGWLTAAAGVSLSILAAGYGAATLWSVVGLLLALLVGMAVQFRLTGAPTFGIAIAWGLLGVTVKNFSSGGGSLAVFAMLSAGLMLWAAFRSELRHE